MTDLSLPENNPLLRPSTLPYGAPEFDKIKIEHYLPAMKVAVAKARDEIEAIKNNDALPTFENTIEALEFSGSTMSHVMGVFSNMALVNTGDDIRAIEQDMNREAVRFGNDVLLDEVLFERVKSVYQVRDRLQVTPEKKRLIEETYEGFAKKGALLDHEKKGELRAINERLSELSTEFENNTVKSSEAYKKVVDNEADLAGIPDRVKAMYRENAEEAGLAGKYVIRLEPPPSDLFEYAENRALREEIYRANNAVAYKDSYDNGANVMEIVQLRHRKAQLLGYPTYAAMSLDGEMAGSAETVMDFLKKNQQIYRQSAEKDIQALRDLAEKKDGVTDMQPWDVAYYARLLREDTFKINMEDLRPYFDLEKVLEGVRRHAEKLFNIDMVETKGKYETYHPDVKVYEVFDKSSDEIIGIFYADYYARPGTKSGGAWMNVYRNRGDDNGVNQFSIVTNVCNFAKPTKDHPSLLSIDEVRTVFHEFGHGLHALLAKGKYASMAGTNVRQDFVELPSQLQENWVREKEVLDSFAKHHKTGATLPEDVIKKVYDMDNFMAGYYGLRQTFFALLDMKWHANDPVSFQSVEAVEDSVVATASLFPRVAGPASTQFGHLFSGGYAAGYYGYKWAEVLDADVFSEFKKKGLYDRETADRLRDTIYACGNTKDPMELFKDMMGREPDPKALFHREGLQPDNSQAPARPFDGPKPGM